MESYRRFRGAWRKRGGGRYNGKLPAIQRRVVTAKEEERRRPIQWKVTGDSGAGGNCEGGREERPIQWKFTGDSEARGNCEEGREAAADTMESYRRLRRRKRGSGRYNGKLPVIQRRVVTAKEEERQRPIQWKVTDDSEARDHIAARGGY